MFRYYIKLLEQDKFVEIEEKLFDLLRVTAFLMWYEEKYDVDVVYRVIQYCCLSNGLDIYIQCVYSRQYFDKYFPNRIDKKNGERINGLPLKSMHRGLNDG